MFVVVGLFVCFIVKLCVVCVLVLCFLLHDLCYMFFVAVFWLVVCCCSVVFLVLSFCYMFVVACFCSMFLVT